MQDTNNSNQFLTLRYGSTVNTLFKIFLLFMFYIACFAVSAL